MKARIAGAFVLGFAVGALCLSVGLWRAGILRTAAASSRPLPQPPFDLNTMLQDARNLPPVGGTVVPPIDYAQPAPPPASRREAPPVIPAPTGEADRTAPIAPDIPPLHLAMPIAGISPKTINDTFEAVRDGHKHEALDIMAPRGTPVLAVAEGNVVKLFNSKQGGLTVYQFDNTGKYCFYYAHLDRYAPGLKEGTLLRQGEVLGYVGTTGDASDSAPHLHLAVSRLGPDKKWWDGTPIDPLPLLQ